MLLKYRDQWPKQRVALSDPTGQCRALQFDPRAGVNAALPVERQVIAVLRNQHVREQTGTRQASGNRPARRGGLNDPVTGSASVLRANMPDDPQARGYVFEDFSNVVAPFLQGTATVRAAVIRWQMFD